jgi:hypothetical protein
MGIASLKHKTQTLNIAKTFPYSRQKSRRKDKQRIALLKPTRFERFPKCKPPALPGGAVAFLKIRIILSYSRG